MASRPALGAGAGEAGRIAERMGPERMGPGRVEGSEELERAVEASACPAASHRTAAACASAAAQPDGGKRAHGVASGSRWYRPAATSESHAACAGCAPLGGA